MTRKAILLAYFEPISLGLLFALGAYLNGDPAKTVFLKSLIGPMYILASLGLRQHFTRDNDATRSTTTWVEFLLLDSALLSAALILILPDKTESAVHLIGVFVIMTLAMTALRMLIRWLWPARGGIQP